MTDTEESLSFDRIADEYDETRGGEKRARTHAAELARLLPAGGPLLEIGIGTGLIAWALDAWDRRAVGVDISPKMLRHANRRIPGRVAVGDALRLPIASVCVPAAYLTHVLHLVGDVGQALGEVARVLRPGGVVVVSVSHPTGPPRSDLEAVRMQLERDLGLPSNLADDEQRVIALARPHGLQATGRGPEIASGQGLSPTVAAELIAKRSWSWTWRCDDARWAPAAALALERIRALPDQDRPRTHASGRHLLTLRKTG